MTYICLVDWINLSLTNSDQRMWLWRCPHNQYNHHQPRYHNINSSTRFQELYQTRKFWSDKHNLGQKNKKKKTPGLSPAIIPLGWPLSCFSVCQCSIHVFVVCQEWQFHHENGKLTGCTPNMEKKNVLCSQGWYHFPPLLSSPPPFPPPSLSPPPPVGGPHLFNCYTHCKKYRTIMQNHEYGHKQSMKWHVLRKEMFNVTLTFDSRSQLLFVTLSLCTRNNIVKSFHHNDINSCKCIENISCDLDFWN